MKLPASDCEGKAKPLISIMKSQKASKLIDPARVAAYLALLELWQNGGTLGESLFKNLDANLRARALRLSREVLRNEAGFDRVIKNFAPQKPFPPLRAMAHLGLHELYIDEASPHGVIDQWVEIAKTTKETTKSAGFLNALLRKNANEPQKLIPTNQFGKPLRKHLQSQYSTSILDAINKTQSHYPRTDLRLRQGENLDEWAQKLNSDWIEGTRTLRLQDASKISELEGFKDGKWWVQDVAASFAVDQFSTLSGKRALDICAAPGGKTLQLADYGANVVAVEISQNRAKRIHENLKRTNLEAEIVIQDALTYDASNFDVVLLDAPCSATGTIRRHPDLRFDAPLTRMSNLIPLQKSLLEKSWSLLNAGGELIYCTCSLLHEEGRAQIDDFTKTHPDATINPLKHPFTGETDEIVQILPHQLKHDTGSDGFFVAKLTKAH